MNLIHKKATIGQINLGQKLNVKINRNSFLISAAILKDRLAYEINDYPPELPTNSQIDYADSLRINIKNETRRTAFQKIALFLYRKNNKAIKELNLKVGDRLKFNDGRIEVISTIKDNGRLYFKVPQFKGCYASQIDNNQIIPKKIAV